MRTLFIDNSHIFDDNSHWYVPGKRLDSTELDPYVQGWFCLVSTVWNFPTQIIFHDNMETIITDNDILLISNEDENAFFCTDPVYVTYLRNTYKRVVWTQYFKFRKKTRKRKAVQICR